MPVPNMRAVVPALAAAAAAMLCQGCAGPQGKHMRVDEAAPMRDGIVYATLAMQVGRPLAAETLAIRPIGQGGPTLAIDQTSRPHDWRATFSFYFEDRKQAHFSQGEEMGSVYAAALPPGDYEIYTYSWRWRSYSAMPDPFFSIPFRVRAGQATYLGRFVGEMMFPQAVAQGSVMTDSAIPKGVRFRIRSEFEQDTALLQAHFPSTKGFKPQGMSIRSCPYAICE